MSDPLRILLVDQNAMRTAIIEEGLHEAGHTRVTIVRDMQNLMRRIVDGLRKERVKTILDLAVSRFNAFNRMRDQLRFAAKTAEVAVPGFHEIAGADTMLPWS